MQQGESPTVRTHQTGRVEINHKAFQIIFSYPGSVDIAMSASFEDLFSLLKIDRWNMIKYINHLRFPGKLRGSDLEIS